MPCRGKSPRAIEGNFEYCRRATGFASASKYTPALAKPVERMRQEGRPPALSTRQNW